MNWFKYARIELNQSISAVQAALLVLKYTHPEIDPANCDFHQLISLLQETGKIPQGMNPERFATQVIFFVKNQDIEQL